MTTTPSSLVVRLALAATCAIATLCAQTRDSSLRYIFHDFGYRLGGEYGSGNVECHQPETGPLRIEWAGGDAVSIDALFSIPGGSQQLSSISELFFLLSGTLDLDLPTQRGVLCWISLEFGPPRSIVLQASREYPEMDAFDVVWKADQQLLYLLDGSTNHMRVAPWTGPGQAFPDPAVFIQAFGPAEVPTLSEEFVKIWEYGDGVRIENLYMEGFDALWAPPSWVFVPTEFLCVGVEKIFGPYGRVKLTPPPTAPLTLNAFLLIDAREADVEPVVDPIVLLPNGGATLSGPAIFPFTIDVAAKDEPATVRWGLDIPSDDLLENVVLFFQIVVLDPSGQVAYTSVRDGAILPASSNPLLALGIGTQQASSAGGRRSFATAEEYLRTVRGEARAARRGEPIRHARAMLSQDVETGAPTEEAKRTMRRLLHAMRR